MDRLGYYVEEKYFKGNKHQAIAFAKFRAEEFNRPVDVMFTGDAGQSTYIGTANPPAQEEDTSAAA